jgi:hypothetical protein
MSAVGWFVAGLITGVLLLLLASLMGAQRDYEDNHQ